MDIKEFNRKLIEEFRANEGKVSGQFANAPLLLLTTIGAKSGQERVNPLVYLEDGDRLVIIASYAGADKNPPWYHNLVANPEVEIEVGDQKFKARSEVVAEPERTELYGRMESAMSAFTEYQQKTTRVIPVVALDRI